MTYLPDVNVWVALTVADHVHHRRAKEWFDSVPNDTLAFCRVTQMGFLRLLTNARVMTGDVFTAERAWNLIERIRRDQRVVFASEPPGFDRVWKTMTARHKSGVNFWTDTYLA